MATTKKRQISYVEPVAYMPASIRKKYGLDEDEPSKSTAKKSTAKKAVTKKSK